MKIQISSFLISAKIQHTIDKKIIGYSLQFAGTWKVLYFQKMKLNSKIKSHLFLIPG